MRRTRPACLMTVLSGTVGVALVALVPSCVHQDMPEDEPCREVGYSIASRTLECEQDAELANGHYERFVEEYACRTDEIRKMGWKAAYACAVQLNTYSCSDVRELGDDFDSWMLDEWRCSRILVHADGAEIPRRTVGAADASGNDACRAAVEAISVKAAYCAEAAGASTSERAEILNRVAHDLFDCACEARWLEGDSAIGEAQACIDATASAQCKSLPDLNASSVEWLEAFAPCPQILTPPTEEP